MSSDRGYGYSEGLTPEEIERLSRFLREIMEDGEEESLSSSTSSESSSSSSTASEPFFSKEDFEI